MRITTKGRYALRAMTRLALETEGKPIPIKKIAEIEELSPEFLEQIFFRLKKEGIVDSVRGPGGGFVLQRDPVDISAKEIFDAVGEGVMLTPCTSEDDDCERKDNCLVREVWEEASEHIAAYFQGLSLADVMKKTNGAQAVLKGAGVGV